MIRRFLSAVNPCQADGFFADGGDGRGGAGTEGCGPLASAEPHAIQNAVFGRLAEPHFAQRGFAAVWLPVGGPVCDALCGAFWGKDAAGPASSADTCAR
jgi:hypothetical protein